MSLPRSPRNVFLQAVLLWALFLAFLVAGSGFLQPLFPSGAQRFTYGGIGTLAALAATALLLRWNRDRWAAAGLRGDRRTVARFFGGLAAGLVLVGVVLLLVYLTTGIRPVRGAGFNGTTVLTLLPFIPLAFMEEIAFRGYPFMQLQRRRGLWTAQGVTALAFAGYHILNGWPPLISFLGPGTWAFVFGIAAARSGGLALPTGIHTGLNMAQALVGLGMAQVSATPFPLQAADGTTGAALSDRMGPAGLAAQALFLAAALFLTYRSARNARSTTQPAAGNKQQIPAATGPLP